MCRIDSRFPTQSLNEKIDPTERFVQALDEGGAAGIFRSLLEKHLSDTWNWLFGRNVEALENALRCAQERSSDAEKIIAFLQSRRLHEHLDDLLFSRFELQQCLANEKLALFNFVEDCARTLFAKSPYRLYKGIFEDAMYRRSPFHFFLKAFYEDRCWLTREFFDDEALAILKAPHRLRTLMELFDSIIRATYSEPVNSSVKDDPQVRNLIAGVTASYEPGPQTRSTLDFPKGIEFIKAWVKFDSMSGRIGDYSEALNDEIARKLEYLDTTTPLYEVDPRRDDDDLSASPRPAGQYSNEWLNNLWRELNAIAFLNADLAEASLEDINVWASSADKFLNPDDPRLTQSHVEELTRWAIESDIKHLKASSDERSLRSASFRHSNKWLLTRFRKTWQANFTDQLSKLSIPERFFVLEGRLDVPRAEDAQESAQELWEWWNGLLLGLLKLSDFPKDLYPRWTIAARYRNFDKAIMVPCIDKSIGLLRAKASVENDPKYHQQLDQLLSDLDYTEPEKALRHRLLLMRFSSAPFTDEAINLLRSQEGDRNVKWYRDLLDLARQQMALYSNKGHRSVSHMDWLKIEEESLEAFTRQVAEFCLGQLRLRKGQKISNGNYETDQIVETSAEWRQGYLKALSELGVDLQGQVHKAVYFVSQSDPNEDVRAVAKECYRSARRESNTSRSIQDMKRGLIAAEWWLMIAQRNKLQLTINYEGALQTRRKLLRHI
jgi:hypothetical protein